MMAPRIACSNLEVKDNMKPSHRALAFFFLVYGSEAILPMDLEYGAPRIKVVTPQVLGLQLALALHEPKHHLFIYEHVTYVMH
jgi:hypothetical protein